LRVNLDESSFVIRGPGNESKYFDIPDDQVGAVVAEFQAIGGDPVKFAAFVKAQASRLTACQARPLHKN
jgi:hypothetical protein